MRELLHSSADDAAPISSIETRTSKEPALPAAFYGAIAEASKKSLARISDALAVGAPEPVLRELHSMKGAFLMAHRHDVGEACHELETIARGGDMAAIAIAFPSFECRVTRAIGQMLE